MADPHLGRVYVGWKKVSVLMFSMGVVHPDEHLRIRSECEEYSDTNLLAVERDRRGDTSSLLFVPLSGSDFGFGCHRCPHAIGDHQ